MAHTCVALRLACCAGILVVEKNEQTEAYTSKKLAYPTILGVTARTGKRALLALAVSHHARCLVIDSLHVLCAGTIASNPHSGWFVGNFGNSFVLAFNGKETSSIAPVSLAMW
jgi:hypothetical protein